MPASAVGAYHMLGTAGGPLALPANGDRLAAAALQRSAARRLAKHQDQVWWWSGPLRAEWMMQDLPCPGIKRGMPQYHVAPYGLAMPMPLPLCSHSPRAVADWVGSRARPPPRLHAWAPSPRDLVGPSARLRALHC